MAMTVLRLRSTPTPRLPSVQATLVKFYRTLSLTLRMILRTRLIRKLKTNNPPLSKSPQSATMLTAKLRYMAMMMIRRVLVSTTSISMTRRIPQASLATTTVVAFAKNTTATFTRMVLRSMRPPKLVSKHRAPWTQAINPLHIYPFVWPTKSTFYCEAYRVLRVEMPTLLYLLYCFSYLL
jgi:hypothetical protein